jgi:hypothetical protein
MASNIVDIAILSPFQFVKRGFANPLPYNTKYMDDWHYPDTLGVWDEKIDYLQPWQNNDIPKFQILSNYAPHELRLYKCDGTLVATLLFAYDPSSIEGTGQKVYKADFALDVYEEGVYRFEIHSGNPVIDIYDGNYFYLKPLHESTVLL